MPDTLVIINPSNTNSLLKDLIAPGAALLGVIVTLLGNYLFSIAQNRKITKIEVQRTLVTRKFDTYLRLCEILKDGITGTKTPTPGLHLFLAPYNSYEKLSDWVNSLVAFASKNDILLDEGTKTIFLQLNYLIIQHLSEISDLSQKGMDKDNETIRLGVEHANEVSDLCKQIKKSAVKYIKDTYDSDI